MKLFAGVALLVLALVFGGAVIGWPRVGGIALVVGLLYGAGVLIAYAAHLGARCMKK